MRLISSMRDKDHPVEIPGMNAKQKARGGSPCGLIGREEIEEEEEREESRKANSPQSTAGSPQSINQVIGSPSSPTRLLLGLPEKSVKQESA